MLERLNESSFPTGDALSNLLMDASKNIAEKCLDKDVREPKGSHLNVRFLLPSRVGSKGKLHWSLAEKHRRAENFTLLHLQEFDKAATR